MKKCRYCKLPEPDHTRMCIKWTYNERDRFRAMLDKIGYWCETSGNDYWTWVEELDNLNEWSRQGKAYEDTP